QVMPCPTPHNAPWLNVVYSRNFNQPSTSQPVEPSGQPSRSNTAFLLTRSARNPPAASRQKTSVRRAVVWAIGQKRGRHRPEERRGKGVCPRLSRRLGIGSTRVRTPLPQTIHLGPASLTE